jgi:hypothetical protein
MNSDLSHPAERPSSNEPISGRDTPGEFEITACSDGCFPQDGGHA